ncbi:MAG: sugar ABC transporter substrate-binding protein [Epulopiscium sp. Nele67-Bin004]|nr:MAG: sugar ABC transporter substrate-binding protein [Epulopiscium sp. Nele67-Bin004]
MNFKKFNKLVLALMATTALVACSSDEAPATNNTNNNTSNSSNSNNNSSSSTPVTEQEEAFTFPEITQPVEITFWHAMNGGQESALTALTEKFMAQNDYITVTLQNQSSYNDLNQKLSASLISPDQLPTMSQAYLDWMYYPLEDNLIVDLLPYVEDPEIGIGDFADINYAFLEPLMINGSLYGMPFNKSSEVIWYNKTMFDELGLTAPTTYEEFEQVAKAITDAKGITAAGFDSLSSYFVTYLNNYGVVFDSTVDVTSEVAKDAAQFYLDGINEGYFRIAGTDFYLSGPLGSELVGMYVGSNAGESFVLQGAGDKFEVGVAPYPAHTAIQQGTDIFVFNSASELQQRAAYEYLKFLTETDSQIEWAVATGYIPIRETAFASDEYKNSGSMVAQIADQMVPKFYNKPSVNGAASAFTESATAMETILATTNPDIDRILSNLQATLGTIW